MVRKDVDNHIKNECPLQEIECVFSIAGCSAKVQRKDMPKHLVDCGPQHAAMASLETLQFLKLEMKEKDDRLKRMVAMEKCMVQLEAKVQESQDIDRYIKGEAPYTIIGPPIVMPSVFAVISGVKDWRWTFTTHLNGYQVCFFVRKKLGYFSVACESMAGAHDDKLNWPVDIHIVIRLLNQLQNAHHAEFHICMEKVRQIVNPCTIWTNPQGNDQVVYDTTQGTYKMIGKSVVADRCLTFAELEYDEKCNTQYLKGDTLKFQIEILKLDTV